MIDTARFYHTNRDFLLKGEMLHPGKIDCARKTVEFLNRGTYSKKGEYSVATHELPVVFYSIWKSPSGKRAVILVNWSRNEEKFALKTRDVSCVGVIPALSWKKVEF
jgi:hypothetical protein